MLLASTSLTKLAICQLSSAKVKEPVDTEVEKAWPSP